MSWFGFAWVPNALNLELDLLGLFEFALVLAIVLASWRGRAALHCSRRNASSPMRLACCARGRVVLYSSRGRPPESPFSAALGLAAALCNLLRVGVLWCVCVLDFQ